MERERVISKHESIVQPFIKDAFKEGSHRIKPKNFKSPNRWFRQIMIGVVYNDIGSTETLEESAEKYGTFRQSVARSNKSFLRNLWNNSSPELQDRYPLNEILTARKSLSQRLREEASAVRGGTSLRIKAQVESGVTDIAKISKNIGLSKQAIRSASRSSILKDWGENLPPSKIALYRKDMKELEEESDDEKIQERLDKLSYSVIRRDMRKKREASQFSTLKNIIREAGFRSRDNLPFATSLKSAGVAISIKERVVKGAKSRTQTYYILLSCHKDRAIKALKEDQSLQRFQR